MNVDGAMVTFNVDRETALMIVDAMHMSLQTGQRMAANGIADAIGELRGGFGELVVRIETAERLARTWPDREEPLIGGVDVKDYGAVGDGVHDDTEAFKRAIAAATHTPGECITHVEGHYFNIVGEFDGQDVSRCTGCGLTIVDLMDQISAALEVDL